MPTMTDIARECGVSTSTVSLVINGKGRISPETRNRIMDTLNRLGYDLEAKKAAPAPVRTNTIALVLPQPQVNIQDGYYYRAISTVFQTTREYGFDSKIMNQEDFTSRVIDGFHKGKDQLGCDGVILFSPNLGWEALLDNLKTWSMPVAVVRRSTDREGVACFLDDDYKGTRQAVEHLADAGHRTIAILTRSEFQSVPTSERIRAWHDVLTERGLAADPRLDLRMTEEPGEMQARLDSLAAEGLRITAVVAINDITANWMVDTLQRTGRRVPEDVAVTGYDDDPVAVSRYPRLTTVRIPVEDMVTAACRTLVRWMPENNNTQSVMKFKNELIIRDSTR